jgi:uncharacterized protein YkwD
MRYFVLAMWAMGAFGCGGTGDSSGGGGSGGGSASGAVANQSPHVQHNLATLNMYRAQNGVAALTLDDDLTAFSIKAAQQFESSGTAHEYFMQQAQSMAIWNEGFCSGAGENQAPGSDWNIGSDEDATIDSILGAMMSEGPGGGHHDNIVNSAFTRVGVGLVVTSSGGLWFSNDFSNACN